MVDVEELWDGHEAVQRLRCVVRLVAGEERSGVIDTLDECVNGVAVGLDTGNDHGSVFVFEGRWLTNTSGTASHSLAVDACGVVTREGDVLDAVTVLRMVRRELLVVRVQR